MFVNISIWQKNICISLEVVSIALKQFISGYAKFAPEALDDICQKFRVRHLKKNDFILREGEVCNDLIFVQQGCLRLYYIHDDVEISVWFAMRDSSAIEIYSFISGMPTQNYLQAIEDSEILYLPKQEVENFYKKYPQMQEMMRKFWEDVILNLLVRFTALQRDTAEERYLGLLNKPEYLQAIPQKYLASFIGVTPTSLSRIKKLIRR